MNYELAKKLKDAGFPIIERADESSRERQFIQKMGGEDRLDIVYAPTLSELIAACGIWFYSLTSHLNQKWSCRDESGAEYEGSTPEIAVANLYLALHPKS